MQDQDLDEEMCSDAVLGWPAEWSCDGDSNSDSMPEDPLAEFHQHWEEGMETTSAAGDLVADAFRQGAGVAIMAPPRRRRAGSGFSANGGTA